jgi:hypothetical protein
MPAELAARHARIREIPHVILDPGASVLLALA